MDAISELIKIKDKEISRLRVEKRDLQDEIVLNLIPRITEYKAEILNLKIEMAFGSCSQLSYMLDEFETSLLDLNGYYLMCLKDLINEYGYEEIEKNFLERKKSKNE